MTAPLGSVLQAFYDFVLAQNINGVTSRNLTTTYLPVPFQDGKARQTPTSRLLNYYIYYNLQKDFQFRCSKGVLNRWECELCVDIFSSPEIGSATIDPIMNQINYALLEDPTFLGLHTAAKVRINSCLMLEPGKIQTDEALSIISSFGIKGGARHFMTRFAIHYEKVLS